MKMEESTKTGGVAKRAHSQGVRWSDQEAYRASSSDREDRERDQGDSRTRSGLRKVSGSTGRSLTSGGQSETSRRREVVVKSEPAGARPKSKLIGDRKDEKKEFNESKRRKTVKLKTPVVVKQEKLTDNEEENKSKKIKESR